MFWLLAFGVIACHAAAVSQLSRGLRHRFSGSQKQGASDSNATWSNMSSVVQRDLIFDIGFNKGGDAINYLADGYRVVGVEADPGLVTAALQDSHFSGALQGGRLQLVHRAVGGEHAPPELPFWQYGRYDEGVWGSVGGPHRKCKECNSCCHISAHVKTMTCEQLMVQYGVPLYMKIDVEGADADCISSISSSRSHDSLPLYISFEVPDATESIAPLKYLESLGFTRFKTVAQAQHNVRSFANPYQTSGPFGSQAVNVTTGETSWLGYQDVLTALGHAGCQPPDWCDIHAMRADSLNKR